MEKILIPKHIETWDYLGYKNEYWGGTQRDWLTTLLTVIIKVDAQIFGHFNKSANKIEVNTNLFTIIESFPYSSIVGDEIILANRMKLICNYDIADDVVLVYRDVSEDSEVHVCEEGYYGIVKVKNLPNA